MFILGGILVWVSGDRSLDLVSVTICNYGRGFDSSLVSAVVRRLVCVIGVGGKFFVCILEVDFSWLVSL